MWDILLLVVDHVYSKVIGCINKGSFCSCLWTDHYYCYYFFWGGGGVGVKQLFWERLFFPPSDCARFFSWAMSLCKNVLQHQNHNNSTKRSLDFFPYGSLHRIFVQSLFGAGIFVWKEPNTPPPPPSLPPLP